MPKPEFPQEVQEWHQEQRDQWKKNNDALVAVTTAIQDALGGGLMSQLDDLMAAVAADQAATDSAVALLNDLQDQVTALQASVADLQAQIDAGAAVDLTAVTAQVQALADSLTAAEAPNEPPA